MRMSSLRAALHLAQRHLDRARRRRVVEVRVAVFDVGGRLAVGDHDDLLLARLRRQQLAGERERVLHVGAPLEVPRRLGEPLGLHLAGDATEAHHSEVVARELRA